MAVGVFVGVGVSVGVDVSVGVGVTVGVIVGVGVGVGVGPGFELKQLTLQTSRPTESSFSMRECPGASQFIEPLTS